jgi:hypothetical protein
LDKANFQIGIVINDAATGKIKHDPKYVDFLVTAWSTDNGNWKKEAVGGAHTCTDEDLAKFYPPDKGAKKQFEFYVSKKAIICMNKYDKKGKLIPRILFGNSGTSSRSLDITYIPCVPKQLTPYN